MFKDNKFLESINKVDITKALQIEFSITDIIDFASSVWTIQNKFEKINTEDSLLGKKRAITSNINKIKNILDLKGIEIIDFTNKKYNEGLNVDILSYEKNSETFEPYIKETIIPAIIFKGNIIQKAKVIVETNEVE